MEEEPLLTGSINQDSGDYGSHDNGHEDSLGHSTGPSYSATEEGMTSDKVQK